MSKNRQSPSGVKPNRRGSEQHESRKQVPQSTPSPQSQSQSQSPSRPNAWSKGAPHVSSTSSPVSTSANNSQQSDNGRLHMHDRLGFLLGKSIGCDATVTVTSGAQYSGVFTGASTDNGEFGVVLKYARKTGNPPGDEDDGGNSDERYDTLIIPTKDFADIVINEPNMAVEKLDSSFRPTDSRGFKTDTDISGNTQSVERELERWQPEEGDELGGALDDLDSTGGAWDQFAVNQEKFGVHSTYDEHYYTTAINKNMPNFDKIAQKAEKIAQEITTDSSYGGNVHIAEERGLKVDDSGLDEEDKYSGVDRRTTTTGNKYTPPQFRKDKTPDVPDDPAILASSRMKPDSTKKPNIEKELAGNFRQFVNLETERLTQKKQYLQKKEMSEQFDRFKKFSEGYKINAPVPPDLIPILAKGKDKQEEIKQRAAANVTSKKTSEEKPQEKKAPAPAPAPAAAAPSVASTTDKKPPQPAPSSPKKFNFNAAEFKPNPSATSFTPMNPALSSHSSSPRQSPAMQSATPQSPYHHNKQTRTPTPAMFFGSQKQHPANKSKAGKFNPFLRAKRDYDAIKEKHDQDPSTNPSPPPYIIERAFGQGPTWPAGASDKPWLQAMFSSYENTPRSQYASPRPPPAVTAGGFPGGAVPMMPPPTGFETDPNMAAAAAAAAAARMMGSPPPPMPAQMLQTGFMPYPSYPYYSPQQPQQQPSSPQQRQNSNAPPPQFMAMNQFPMQYYGNRSPQAMAGQMYYGQQQQQQQQPQQQQQNKQYRGSPAASSSNEQLQ